MYNEQAIAYVGNVGGNILLVGRTVAGGARVY